MNIWRHTAGRQRLYRPSVTSAARMPDCAECPVRDHSLCVGLKASELPRISAMTTVHQAQAGEVLFFEGDPARHFFTIRKGVIRLVRGFPDGRRSIVGFLHDGDFLGSRFGNASYQVTAEAVTAIEYCRILLSDLQKLAADLPGLERQLLTMSADRMDAAENHIVLLGRKTAIEKVAAFLLASQEWGNRKPDGEFDLPMSRVDIADYLGLTIETVSRIMTRLVDSGLISISDARHIKIIDQLELKATARPEGFAVED